MYQQPAPQYGQGPDFNTQYFGGGPMNQAALCNPETTLWMGDLKPEWDADFIKNAFRHFSVEVRNVKMVTDRFGSKSTYCFVEFNNPDAARNSMLTLCGRSIPDDPDRSKFNLSFANSPNQCTEYNLFVTNLSQSVDDVALYRVFGEKYDSCRGAKVYRNADGSSREFGFVRFTNETDQQRALVEMNKHRLKSKEMVLKLAQPKERRGPRYLPRSGNDDRRGGYDDRRGGYDDRRGGGYDDRRGGSYGRSGGGGSRYANGNDNPSYLANQQMGGLMPMGGMMGGGMPIGVPQLQQPYMGMAPNHGVAGYGIPTVVPMQPQYGVPNAMPGAPQYIMAAPVQYQNVMPQNVGIPYQNGNSLVAVGDPRALHPGAYMTGALVQTPVALPPQQIYIEGEEPMTAEEHNKLLMNMSGDFLNTLESSRWNRVALPMGVRPKELTSILYNA